MKNDQKELEKLLSGGVQPIRAVLRGMAFLQLGKGVSALRIAEFIALTPPFGRWSIATLGLETQMWRKNLKLPKY